MRKIHILGNCQVGGIADSISLLFDNIEVEREIHTFDITALSSVLEKHLKSQGFLIACDSVKALIGTNQSLSKFQLSENIYFPTISFAAFHPDIQYVFVDGSVVKNGLGGDWNSRILLWAYLNGLSQTAAQELFCKETFDELGYFNEWNRSNEDLEHSFLKTGFDYGRWIRKVKRSGVFMYGINHPNQIALSELSVQLAEKIFPDMSAHSINLHGLTSDYLSHIVWPIYPEIGERLGLEGQYLWRASKKICDLNDFTEMCYNAYDDIDLRNQNLKFIPLITKSEDEILRAKAKV